MQSFWCMPVYLCSSCTITISFQFLRHFSQATIPPPSPPPSLLLLSLPSPFTFNNLTRFQANWMVHFVHSHLATNKSGFIFYGQTSRGRYLCGSGNTVDISFQIESLENGNFKHSQFHIWKKWDNTYEDGEKNIKVRQCVPNGNRFNSNVWLLIFFFLCVVNILWKYLSLMFAIFFFLLSRLMNDTFHAMSAHFFSLFPTFQHFPVLVWM